MTTRSQGGGATRGRTIRTMAFMCLTTGLVIGAAAAPPLPEDEEESPTIERELQTRRRPGPTLPPAPPPVQAVRVSGSYGISLARVSDGERAANLPFAIQWDLASGAWSLAVESDGPTRSSQGDSSVSGMSDVDLWARWTPSKSSLSAKFGITVGTRGAVGNDFDRAFAHLYQNVALNPNLTAMLVVGVRQRINHRQQNPGATGEVVAELSRRLASGSAVQSAFVKITHVKPQAGLGKTKIRLGVDVGVSGGTLTPTVTRKLSQGGGSTTLAVDWVRAF